MGEGEGELVNFLSLCGVLCCLVVVFWLFFGVCVFVLFNIYNQATVS